LRAFSKGEVRFCYLTGKVIFGRSKLLFWRIVREKRKGSKGKKGSKGSRGDY